MLPRPGPRRRARRTPGSVRGRATPGKASSASPSGDEERRVGRRRSCARRPATAPWPASRMLMPTNCARSPSSFAAATTAGASARQGVHQDPQTTTTTGLPRRSGARAGRRRGRRPRRSRPGRRGPSAATSVTAPSLVTKPLSPVPSQRRCSPSARAGRRAAGAAPAAAAARTLQGRVSSGAPPAENGALLSRARGSGRRRARSRTPGEPVADEVERRQRAQRALALARVVEERPLLGRAAG